MKTIIFIAAFYSASVFSSTCAPVPARADGKTIQTFKGLTGKDEQRGKFEAKDVYGPDIIYQGEGCPAGKICIESVYSIYGNLQTTHGQVVVIDSASGNVEEILPLRTKETPPPPGQPLSQSGVRPLDPERINRVCAEFKKTGDFGPEWCGQMNRKTGEYDVSARTNIDTYAYGNYTESGKLISGSYVPLSPESRPRIIQALNSGNRTNAVAFITPQLPTNTRRAGIPDEAVDWSQVNSIQKGSKGTLNRLAKLVGEVRQRLGCEPVPSNPEIRLRQAALDSREGLGACGLKFDPGNGLSAFIRCEKSPCTSGKGQLSRPIVVDLTQKSSSDYECKSKFRGDVETITCKYRDVNSKITQTFQIQKGKLLAIESKDSEQRGEYTCALAAPTRSGKSEKSRSGTRVQDE